jgi:WhiB family redox-sensing transcriptional regulator
MALDGRAGLSELLDLLFDRPAWHADAACKEHPEVDFFPALGQSAEPAKAVCARCLVREDCLVAGMAEHFGVSPPGIWGGLSGRQRRMVRQGKLDPTAPPPAVPLTAAVETPPDPILVATCVADGCRMPAPAGAALCRGCQRRSAAA